MYYEKIPPTREELKQNLCKLQRFPLETCLAKRIPKWSKGRLFCVHNENILTFCTNHPSVNHLDLQEIALLCDSYNVSNMFPEAEFSFTFCTNHPSIRHLNLEEPASPCGSLSVSELSSEHPFPIPAKRFPFLTNQFLPSVLHSCAKLPAASKDILAWHHHNASEIIDGDGEIMGLISLLDRWDDRKFMRLLDYRLLQEFSDRPSGDRSIDCQLYVEIVLSCSENPISIVKALEKICTRFLKYGDIFLLNLPLGHIDILNWHLKRVYSEYFDSVITVDWLNNEDLLLDTLFAGAFKTLKFALELEWPSKLLPFTVPLDAASIPGRWPLEKDGVAVRSFHSLEYFRTFTRAMVAAVKHVLRHLSGFTIKSDLITCIHLIWRAIPTPYLPIEDMRECVSFSDLDGYEDRETELRSILEDGYEEGCPSVFEPRSLKQLSKCAVRRRCRSPAQISLLPVPEKLRKYINLEI